MAKHFTLLSIVPLTQIRQGLLILALASISPAAIGQSFAPATLQALGTAPQVVALGDVNGDGRVDIVSANSGSNNVGVLLGQPGGFAPMATYSTGANSEPRDIALGDVNGDGRLDIVSANFRTDNVSVFLGTGGGAFAPAVYYSSYLSARPKGIALGDVNNDGRLDIVAVDDFGWAVVFLQQASGFVFDWHYGSGQGPHKVVLRDVNNDGRLDVITTNPGSTSVGVLLAQASTPTTPPFATAADYFSFFGPANDPNEPYGLALGDVNRDGFLDMVTAHSYTGIAGVRLGQSGGAFGPMSSYSTLYGFSGGVFDVALGGVNGDGLLDIVGTLPSHDVVAIWLGQANGSFPVSRSTFYTGLRSHPWRLALGDVNGDGRLDIVTTNIDTNNAAILLNTGTFTPLASLPAGTRPAAGVVVFPNPAHEAFTVQIPATFSAGPIQAELLNALGQTVRRPAVSGATHFRIETTGLPPGLYTLRLRAGSNSLTKRVVVD